MGTIYGQDMLMKIPIIERINICEKILKTEKDESLRGEAVWVLGSTSAEITSLDPLRSRIADLLEYVLLHDDNVVVKHEACFQLGEFKFREKVSALANAALNDKSELVRHEAVEAIGLLKLAELKSLAKQALNDDNDAVRQTAVFVVKKLDRLGSLKEELIQ